MSTIIKFDIKELKKLVSDKNSCVVEKKVVQNVALRPWCLGNLKEALKNVLDYKIGKFDVEFNGILLAYKNVHVLQNIGAIKNDSADIIFQVQVDYFIFMPRVGATLKGIVNKKSITHLGVLVHRVFNVVITRPTEEPGSKWLGSTVQEGQTVVFRIVVMDLFGALPYIRGELDERFLQLGNDDDPDEPVGNHVAYVNFEKIKPRVVRHNGDVPHSSPTGSTSSTCNKGQPNNVASDISMGAKSKSKRQKKVPHDEVKKADVKNRQTRKHRKD